MNREAIIEQALAHLNTPGTLPDTQRWVLACVMDSAVRELLRQPDHGHEPQHGLSMREVLEEVEAAPRGPNETRCVILTDGQWETLRRWIHTVYIDALNE
jgi:hypothetical protein